jgi:hypothetical protein
MVACAVIALIRWGEVGLFACSSGLAAYSFLTMKLFPYESGDERVSDAGPRGITPEG